MSDFKYYAPIYKYLVQETIMRDAAILRLVCYFTRKEEISKWSKLLCG